MNPTKTKQAKTKPYLPSNGTEGEIFMENHCYLCVWWHGDGEDGGCPIQDATHQVEIDDPFYPSQWVQNDDGTGAQCLSFIRNEDRKPAVDLSGLTPEQREWYERYTKRLKEIDAEEAAFKVFANLHPREAYEKWPSRFWNLFQKERPNVSFATMIQLLDDAK